MGVPLAFRALGREPVGKRQTASALDGVNGIGPKRKQMLLSFFGSVKRLMEAPADSLQALLGEKVGKEIFDNLHANDAEKA